MPRLHERLAQQRNQFDSFPASTGQDSCRRAVKIVDIDQTFKLLVLSPFIDKFWDIVGMYAGLF